MELPSKGRTPDRIARFGPPYTEFKHVTLQWRPVVVPPRGQCLLWWLVNSHEQSVEFDWLHHRPSGIPLIVVLPPAKDIQRTLPMLNHIGVLEPRAILPLGQLVVPPHIRHLLSVPPTPLADAVTHYLSRRKLFRNARIRNEVREIIGLSRDVTTVSDLARRMCMSRRTLGRHFNSEGLPVPSHWLQFGRLLRVACSLQSEQLSVSRAAARVNYPDGFTLSNQMKRLFGFRPTEIRQYLGWEWLVEAWLHNETRNGSPDES